MWRKDYDDKKAATNSPRGGTATVSSTGGYAVGPAPPTFSGPQKSMPLPQYTPPVFNSMQNPPTLGQSVTAPRAVSPSAPQSLKASAAPQRMVTAVQPGPQRAASSPRGSLALPAAANTVAAPTAALPNAVAAPTAALPSSLSSAPLTALAGSGSMRVPSFAMKTASPRASPRVTPPTAVSQSAFPSGPVRGGSLRLSSRPAATGTASPRASSGWSSVPASVMPLAASMAAPMGGLMQMSSSQSPVGSVGVAAPAGGSVQLPSSQPPMAPVGAAGGSVQISSLSSPLAPVELSQSISPSLISSIKQAAATSLKPAVPLPIPNQTSSNPFPLPNQTTLNPFTKAPTFSTATNASNSQAQAKNVQGTPVLPPKPLLAGPLFNSMDVSQKFSAAPIMPPTSAIPGRPVEGPPVSPLLPSRGLPLMASLPVQALPPVQHASQGVPPSVGLDKPVDAALQHLQELQMEEEDGHQPQAEQEEPGVFQAMLPWAFAETTPAVPMKAEAPRSPHASPYATLEEQRMAGHDADNGDRSLAMVYARSKEAAVMSKQPVTIQHPAAELKAASYSESRPQQATLTTPGPQVPGLVGAPALGPPVAVQPLSPVGSSMPVLGQPSVPSSPVLPASSPVPISASLPGSPMGSGLAQPVLQPPINIQMGPSSLPPMSAPPMMGPMPFSPPMVSPSPLAPALPPSPRPVGSPVALPPRPMSPHAVGTPNFFSSNSVDTVPYGTPEHTRNVVPMGLPPVVAPMVAPMVPETRPASPSLGRPLMMPMRAPPIPVSPARSPRPLPHPDPGLLHTPQNVDLGREVAIREVELRVLRKEVIAKEEEAVDLRDRIGAERLKFEDASGENSVMEKKVGTIQENRHAVLQASCVQLSEKNSGLHKRLMQMEAEWNEKEIEIEMLKQAVAVDEEKVRRMHEELGDLDLDHQEQGQKARWLAQHKEGLQRKAAIDVWHDTVQAQVQEETHLHAMQQQKKKMMEQMEVITEECSALRSLIPNLEHKCQLHVQGIEATHKRYEEMEMEVRLTQTASKMAQEVAAEQSHSQVAELEGLKARLEQQRRHNAQVIGTHQARNQHEVSSVQHMAELISLTECMREITSVLRAKGVKLEEDPLQRAVDEEVDLLHHIKDAPVHGQPPPAVGGPPLGPIIPGVGRSRSASPGPTAMEAFAPASPWSGPGRPRLPSTPRSHSPAALYQGSPPPPGMMPSGPGWGMPALVAPIPIGGAMR